MRTKEERINWLRDEGVLNLFYLNYYQRRSDWPWAKETIEEQLLSNVDNVFNDAFRWSDTSEGHHFWSDINSKFLEWY